MRVLFVSNDLIAGNLALLLKREGCDVKLFIENNNQKQNLGNLINKTPNWKKELKWVGKKGLIVFDDIGYGAIQEKLRLQGYSVFGGSRLGDKLEEDRAWSQDIFKKYGLSTLQTVNLKNIRSAINYVKKNTGSWVIKQNGNASKCVNYVGKFNDGQDVISVLETYLKNYGNDGLGEITLQKRIHGVEIGIGRYFNGEDWVGPIEMNVEHKKLFPGEIGPTTGEMGTLAWYDPDEGNVLFQKTLAKLKPFLKKIDFRGDFDIGCMVNENGIFTLEATPRMGSPIIHLHSEIHISGWAKFLKAIADKKPFNLRWKKGFGIVVMVCMPPFPYVSKLESNSPFGLEIFFSDKIKDSNFKHVHFEDVSAKKVGGKKKYYISDHRGYILYVSSIANSIKGARDKAQKILREIHIPKMFYRNDIGLDFEKNGMRKLKDLGYLTA